MSDGRIAVLERRGVVAVGGPGRGDIPQRSGDRRYQPRRPRTGGLRRPADTAGQDPVRLHRVQRRRPLPLRPAARACRRFRQAPRLLQAARQGHGRGHLRRNPGARRLGARGRASHRRRCGARSAPGGARLADDRAGRPAAGALRLRRRRRKPTTTPTASRSAFPKAASTSPSATPFRTTPTWTSSPASISARAAISARRSSRACSIAAPPAAASSSRRPTGALPAAGTEVTAGGKPLGLLGSSAGDSGAGASPARPRERSHRCRHADCGRRCGAHPRRFPAGRPSAGRRLPIRTDRRTGNWRNWRGKRRTRRTMPKRKDTPPRAWQRMLSGRRLDLLDPSPLDIEIDDIAHGLARVARWNGQTIGAARLLGRPAHAGRGGDRRHAGAGDRRRRAAGGDAARCAGICARRSHLAVQGAARRRISGGRAAAARRHPPPLRIARAAARGADRQDQGGRPHLRLFRGRGAGRFRRGRGGARSSAGRAASTAERLDLAPWPAAKAERQFLQAFQGVWPLRPTRRESCANGINPAVIAERL